MADNVNYQSATLATPAASTSVATDDVSGQHFQKIKIADGAADSSAMIGGDATNGLDVDVTRVQGTVQVLGTVQTHGTSQIIGTVQAHGTNQALGTFQPLAGSVHLAAGSVNAQGVVAHDSAAGGNPVLVGAFGSSGTQAAVNDGDAVRLWADLNGRLQVRGTIDSLPNVTIGNTVTVTGTVQAHGTAQVLGTVQTHGTSQVLGTVQTHGTSQVLGTTQPLAGSVHLATNLPGGTVVAVGSAVHGAVADTRPLLISAFGSSGTQAAVDDGDAVRLWADLNGRLQVRGTIDSLVGTVQTHGTSQVLGTVQTHGTSQVLGTVQTHGTSQALGTFQPLGGSVQGWVAHDSAAGGAPVLTGAFGSSGTQAAVSDGDAVRLWADVNGRLQVRGTIDSIPSITVSSMPTTTVTGTVQTHGTSQVLGTVQTHGTSQVLGTVRFMDGSVHLAAGSVNAQGVIAHGAAIAGNPLLVGGFGSSGTQAAVSDGQLTRAAFDLNGRLWTNVQTFAGTLGGGTVQTHGTSQVLGTVRTLPPGGTALGETYFSTIYTAAANDVTIIAAPSSGTFIRIYDILISGSAAGTFRVLDSAEGTHIGHLHLAANGGWNFNSSRGVRTRAAARAILIDCSAGTWGVFVNYALET